MKITDKILETAAQIPGLDLTGTAVFNNGSEVPLYETREETAESWNRKAKEQFLRYYREDYGEDPKNEDAAFDAYSEFLRMGLGSKIALETVNKMPI